MILETQPDFFVVGDVGDGLAGAILAERLSPDIVLADLVLPSLSGLDLTQRVRRRSPKTRVVVLTLHTSTSYALAALNSGASAFVLKSASSEHLVHAIREANLGRTYVSPPLSMDAVRAYARRSREEGPDLYECLTEREREVLHLASEGLTCASIAARLCISPRTVEAHRAHLMRKLGLANQTELMVYSMKHGLLVSEDTLGLSTSEPK